MYKYPGERAKIRPLSFPNSEKVANFTMKSNVNCAKYTEYMHKNAEKCMDS